MKNTIHLFSLTAVAFILLGATSAFATGTGLVDLLVSKLGVTTQQAEGGAGAIFNTAKESMTAEDFNKVSTAMPEVESLMASAPKAEESSGLLGSASSMLKDNTGSAGKMAGLYDSFSKLGLSKDMIGQFMPLVLNYAESKAGPTVSNLLKAVFQ